MAYLASRPLAVKHSWKGRKLRGGIIRGNCLGVMSLEMFCW